MSQTNRSISKLSSPVKPKISGNPEILQQKPANSEFRKVVAKEMTDYFVGPLPYETFLEDFMPGASDLPACPVATFSNVPVDQGEPNMYQPFIDSIEEAGLCCPDLEAIQTSNTTDKEKENLKPDIVLYLKDFAEKIRAKTQNTMTWRAMEMHIEMKAKASDDPLTDDPSSVFENQAGHATSTRGQMVLYAGAQLSRQHRRWIFSLGIFGKYARFFRWDRAGVIASDRFDYQANPKVLAKFFWRFSHLSPTQRGHDPTVKLATGLQHQQFVAAIQAQQKHMLHTGSRNHPKLADSIHSDFPTWKVLVDDRTEGKHGFLVGKPIFFSRAVTGRCTRGYVALNLDPKHPNQLVFLKDTWRPDNEQIEPERDTYKKLKDSGVPFVAEFLCGDDVPDDDLASSSGADAQSPSGLKGSASESTSEDSPRASDETLETSFSEEDSQNFPSSQHSEYLPPGEHKSKALLPPLSRFPEQPRSSNTRPGAQRTDTQNYSRSKHIRPYIHFRMVQTSLCLPIEEFENGKHLVQIIYDAIKALEAAWKDARIFHRDVSSNNIMINLLGSGILNDWDLCCSLDSKAARQCDRTGTWQFISLRLLSGEESPHELCDDLESAFYVLMYLALHFVKHNKVPGEVNMEDIFDRETAELVDGKMRPIGGDGKSEMFTRQRWVKGLRFKSPPLTDLFWDLHRLFAGNLLYQSAETPDMLSAWSIRSHGQLQNPTAVLSLFKIALARPDWATADKVLDQFPRKSSSRQSESATKARTIDRSNTGQSSRGSTKRSQLSQSGDEYSELKPGSGKKSKHR